MELRLVNNTDSVSWRYHELPRGLKKLLYVVGTWNVNQEQLFRVRCWSLWIQNYTNKQTNKKRLFLLRFKCIICNGNYAESNRRSRGNSNIVDIFHICIMKEEKKTVKKMANWASAIIHNEWMFTFHLTNVIHNNINWKRNAVWCTFLLIEIACTRLPF